MSFFDADLKMWKGISQPSPLNPAANLGQLILNVLERNPNKITQISDDSGVKVTCDEMRLRTIRVAQNLTKMGYGKGDMVCVAAKNGENLAPVLFGCFLIAAPVNTLVPDFNKEDMAHMMGITKPKLVFCDHDNLDVVREAINCLKLSSEIFVFSGDEKLKSENTRLIREVLKETGLEKSFYPNYMGDSEKLLALIVCSSGSTGFPKGVCLSHAHLVTPMTRLNDLDNDDVMLSYSSLFWISGIQNLLFGTFNGVRRVITTEKFEPNKMFEIIKKYRVTFIFSPPSQLALMVQSPDIVNADLSSIKFLVTGGSLVPEFLRDSMNKFLPHGRVYVGYGMSEVAPTITADIMLTKTGSVGHLVPNMRAHIVDDEGNKLGINETGEIYVKYCHTFLGYYNNQEESNNLFDAEGWIKTGDIGYFDQHGLLYLVDRRKEIIKYNNYQISPSELESIIVKFEGVSMAAVVGIPDPIHTDFAAAVVVKMRNSTITEEEVKTYVNDIVADYKKLRGGVFFVEELPMTSNGKINRKHVKQLAINLYNIKS